ncbi:MAG: ribosomal-processing cysteine protease Prp [Oscillospiraceae bacterium]|nr:ribosomal-processing cysteine protease Prp [Oscillospiraceae bacterium]
MLLKARFLRRDNAFVECVVSGHDVYTEDVGYSVLCAAVSSAVQLTSALLCDCFGAPQECMKVTPGQGAQNKIVIRLKEPNPVYSNILNGLYLHFQALAEDFDGLFKVTVETQ